MAKRKRRASIRPVTGGFERSDQLVGGGGLTPAPGYGPPGSPQAPAAPPPPPMPARTYDSIYTTDTGLAQRNYGQTQAELTYQRGNLAYDTGYNADLSLDMSNPYNQALMLQRNWEQERRGVVNSMAGQGQLYSGARRRGVNESDFQYQRNKAGQQTGAQRGYQGLTFDEQRAGIERDTALAAAAAGQAGRWGEAEANWYSRYG